MNTDIHTKTDYTGISAEEREIAKYCIETAKAGGADGVRVTFSKNTLDSLQFLNGEVEKVSHCADRGIYLTLFADGRYGGYSTNRLDRESLNSFIAKALENTRMLAPDECRCLPEPENCAKNALTGHELGLWDKAYMEMDAEGRLEKCKEGVQFASLDGGKKFKLISEECEWSDSTDDNYIVDSQGFEGRHCETSFNFWTEMTIEGPRGRKYSGYDWVSSPYLKDIDLKNCAPTALQKAADAIGPKAVKSGKYNMVVDNNSASRLAAPLLSALSANAIQQNNSFLTDSLGKKMFTDDLSIYDYATTAGKCGARLFDSEGVATKDRGIITNGVIGMYFVNTYMSKKMNLAPTIEGSSRPTVLPFLKGASENSVTKPTMENPEFSALGKNGERPGTQAIDQQTIMDFCGDGILVTGFNGGNCNPTTGNFSYGVEGFLFKNGKILHPISEVLITGNMLTLWNSLIAAGSDPKSGTRWQIPTLAFTAVDFSA